uniref:Putative cytochrome p450 cyp3/cyp5/cyp6/cyp9 subfamily n=1 Tax=Xenopsylla cheopis TaxID=163159 RepID=A0A6M2E210_XENCH
MLLVLLATTLALLLCYLWHVANYWRRKKVVAPSPSEFFGTLWGIISNSEHFGLTADKFYKRFHGQPYYGIFLFFKPLFVVRNLDLVKNVLQTDFASFQKNDFDVNEELEPVLATNPFTQLGQRWKRSRSQITPAFTSGRVISYLLNLYGITFFSERSSVAIF